MFCRNCGTKNEPGAVFCAGCGHRLAEESPQSKQQIPQNRQQRPQGGYQPQPPRKDSSKTILCVVAVVVLLGILGGVAAMFIPKILNKDETVPVYNENNEMQQNNQLLESETTTPETTAYAPILEPTTQAVTEPETTTAAAETQREEKYKIFVGDYNWEEAEARCEEMGGYLVQINDYDEWEYLTETFIPSQNVDTNKFLIGGRRDTSSDAYYWVRNGEKVGDILNDPTSWINQNDVWFYSSKQRQPSFYDDTTKEGEYYLQMFYIEDTSSNREKGRKIGWAINDIALSEQMSFICEFD